VCGAPAAAARLKERRERLNLTPNGIADLLRLVCDTAAVRQRHILFRTHHETSRYSAGGNGERWNSPQPPNRLNRRERKEKL